MCTKNVGVARQIAYSLEQSCMVISSAHEYPSTDSVGVVARSPPWLYTLHKSTVEPLYKVHSEYRTLLQRGHCPQSKLRRAVYKATSELGTPLYTGHLTGALYREVSLYNI